MKSSALCCMALATMIISTSCRKEVYTSNEEGQSIQATTYASNISKVHKTKWGVLTSSQDFTNDEQIDVCKALKVKYVRTAIVMDTWNGVNDKECDDYLAKGYKILLNLSQHANDYGDPKPWLKDTASWRRFVVQVLNKYKPEVVVVDNEEINPQIHSGTPDQYYILLSIAIQEGHKRKLKVTNGGLPVFIEQKAHLNPYYTSTLIKYRSMSLDYVNYHLKYPIDYPLKYMLTYMFNTCGHKPLMTNECGLFGDDIPTLNKEMDETQNLQIPYAIWYSIDTNRGVRALQNTNTVLRPTGNAFSARMY